MHDAEKCPTCRSCDPAEFIAEDDNAYPLARPFNFPPCPDSFHFAGSGDVPGKDAGGSGGPSQPAPSPATCGCPDGKCIKRDTPAHDCQMKRRGTPNPTEQAEAQEARMHAALAVGLAVISDYFAVEALTRGPMLEERCTCWWDDLCWHCERRMSRAPSCSTCGSNLKSEIRGCTVPPDSWHSIPREGGREPSGDRPLVPSDLCPTCGSDDPKRIYALRSAYRFGRVQRDSPCPDLFHHTGAPTDG